VGGGLVRQVKEVMYVYVAKKPKMLGTPERI
jgi:hypothetical protein